MRSPAYDACDIRIVSHGPFTSDLNIGKRLVTVSFRYRHGVSDLRCKGSIRNMQ
ncbi:hypothetical protein HMPREF1155_1316 [Slackia sp. CM382]|nr:hypothetical protein HMPREF1155_1316 [Slackia sp. CM382]